jgi:hypothetical protein
MNNIGKMELAEQNRTGRRIFLALQKRLAPAGLSRTAITSLDVSKFQSSHIGVNVFSNFRRTKYQNSRSDRESTSRRRGGRRQ